MEKCRDLGSPIWILQGEFGRSMLNLMSRPLVEHAHAQFNILLKMGGADTEFIVDGQSHTLSDDTVLLFNPWLPHAKAVNSQGPTLVLSLLVEQQWLARLTTSAPPNLDRLFLEARVPRTTEVDLHARRLTAAGSQNVTLSDEACREVVRDLVQEVVAAYASPQTTRDFVANARPIDFRIRKALGYIHQHALENPPIADIAREVGLSRSRFFEQFRRCVGASPHHYIDWARMAEATRTLSTTGKPLIDVSEELGFSSHSHFTRFFAQHIGISPSEFRRQAVMLTAPAA